MFCIESMRDITINADNINLRTVLYAPYGTVKISGKNITIKGKVIAKKIQIKGDNLILENDFMKSDEMDVINDTKEMEIDYQHGDMDIHVHKNLTLPVKGRTRVCYCVGQQSS